MHCWLYGCKCYLQLSINSHEPYSNSNTVSKHSFIKGQCFAPSISLVSSVELLCYLTNQKQRQLCYLIENIQVIQSEITFYLYRRKKHNPLQNLEIHTISENKILLTFTQGICYDAIGRKVKIPFDRGKISLEFLCVQHNLFIAPFICTIIPPKSC